ARAARARATSGTGRDRPARPRSVTISGRERNARRPRPGLRIGHRGKSEQESTAVLPRRPSRARPGRGLAAAIRRLLVGAGRPRELLAAGQAIAFDLPALRLVEEIARELVRPGGESLLSSRRGRRVSLIEAALQSIELALGLLFARRLRRR